jgi:hypothetical protein
MSLLDPAADGFGYVHSKASFKDPSDTNFPGLKYLDRFEFELQPGDILYNPAWMWHAVQNQTPTIGLRFGFPYLRGALVGSAALTYIRFFAARNPSMFKILYYSMFKGNLDERDNLLVTPKIFRD